MLLKDGIASISDYATLKKHVSFSNIEEYSNRFLKTNDSNLEYYKKKWSKDPLHQWSREYEYPYVFQRVADFLNTTSNSNVRILDAGSGVTFFPYLLKTKFNQVEVTCCDYDSELAPIYKKISQYLSLNVDFYETDIHALPFKDASFDIVYCISVLEHTRDYAKVLDEFKRVLKPGGTLIVTFDISVDGKTDISIEKAEFLLNDINQRFILESKVEKISQADFSKKLTTAYFKNTRPELLPWRFSIKSFAKELLKFNISTSKFFNLAFYCVSAKKSL